MIGHCGLNQAYGGLWWPVCTTFGSVAHYLSWLLSCLAIRLFSCGTPVKGVCGMLQLQAMLLSNGPEMCKTLFQQVRSHHSTWFAGERIGFVFSHLAIWLNRKKEWSLILLKRRHMNRFPVESEPLVIDIIFMTSLSIQLLLHIYELLYISREVLTNLFVEPLYYESQ